MTADTDTHLSAFCDWYNMFMKGRSEPDRLHWRTAECTYPAQYNVVIRTDTLQKPHQRPRQTWMYLWMPLLPTRAQVAALIKVSSPRIASCCNLFQRFAQTPAAPNLDLDVLMDAPAADGGARPLGGIATLDNPRQQNVAHLGGSASDSAPTDALPSTDSNQATGQTSHGPPPGCTPTGRSQMQHEPNTPDLARPTLGHTTAQQPPPPSLGGDKTSQHQVQEGHALPPRDRHPPRPIVALTAPAKTKEAKPKMNKKVCAAPARRSRARRPTASLPPGANADNAIDLTGDVSNVPVLRAQWLIICDRKRKIVI